MKENTPATPAASSTTSLDSLAGSLRQLSAPAAAQLSAILTERLFSESTETIAILIALLQGITEQTVSGDALALGIFRAQEMCEAAGIDMGLFADTVRRFEDFSRRVRRKTPYAY